MPTNASNAVSANLSIAASNDGVVLCSIRRTGYRVGAEPPFIPMKFAHLHDAKNAHIPVLIKTQLHMLQDCLVFPSYLNKLYWKILL